MRCTRCRGEALIRAENAVYCAKCALARQWESVFQAGRADYISMSGDDDSAPPPRNVIPMGSRPEQDEADDAS